MKLLLSYPRSGSHLVRFLIEILTETPTLSIFVPRIDIPIFKNRFPEIVPFNITSVADYDSDKLYTKSHTPPKVTPDEFILIIRNPREVLIRHHKERFQLQRWDGYEAYFDIIDYYNKFEGKKCCFYYEDIVTNKSEFVNSLCLFLDNVKAEKKEYILNNIEKVYEISKHGKGRAWGGVCSNDINFYYKAITNMEFKMQFDNYIAEKMSDPRYEMIKQKYNLG